MLIMWYYQESSVISMNYLMKKVLEEYKSAAIGKEGGKRIDVISTNYEVGGTVFDLSDLELVITSRVSAKDPDIMGTLQKILKCLLTC